MPDCLITSADLVELRRGAADAVGLPRSAYRDPRFFEAEKRAVFGASWLFLCPESGLSAPGDVLPLHIAGWPIVLVRGDTGRLRGFHNVCRHRGTRLVDGPRRAARSLSCAYHGWVYGLDGGLLRAPHHCGVGRHEPDVAEPACLDLVPVRLDTWNQLVFANFSGDAPPLRDHLAPLTRAYPDLDPTELRFVGSSEFHVAANWKLSVENMRECHHGPWVHPALFAASPIGTHTSTYENRLAVQSTAAADAWADGYGDLPVPVAMKREWSARSDLVSLLPNLGLQIAGTHVVAWCVDPVDPTHTIERAHCFVWGDDAATSADLARSRAALMTAIRHHRLEDIALIEEMQAGTASPVWRPRHFSPAFEAGVHGLQLEVAAAVERLESSAVRANEPGSSTFDCGFDPRGNLQTVHAGIDLPVKAAPIR